MPDDRPMGLLVLSARGHAMWFNREAELVCAVCNNVVLRRDALPLNRSAFAVPPVLWRECQELATPEARFVDESERGLHALIRLQPRANQQGEPVFFLQLDCRRPRGDRERPLSPSTLSLLNRLTFREREVVLRIRDGLTTLEIARKLRRSPHTFKTQLRGIFQKLGVTNRARIAGILNR